MATQRRVPGPASRGLSDGALALGVGGVCLALYLATLTPGLSHLEGDGHELTVAAATLGVAHPSGYPLYTWLGFLFTKLPVGEVAYRTNLLSAVSGAAAAGLLALVGRRAGLTHLPAAAAALLFGVSTTFWSQAVLTEVYAPNALLVVLQLWLLLGWARRPDRARPLVPAALVLGLSLGTHMGNVVFAPVYAVFVLLHAPEVLRRPALLAGAMLAFLAGAAQFAWLPFRAHVLDVFPSLPPDGWDRFWTYTLGAFAAARGSQPLEAQAGRLAFYAAQLVQNFTLPGVALGIVGTWCVAWRRPRTFWLLGGVLAANAGTVLQLRVLDVDVMMLPAHAAFAVFAGFGLEAAGGAIRAMAGARGGAAARLATVAGSAALAAGLLLLARGNFARNDRSGDTAVGDFQRAVFAAVPRGSEIVGGRGAFGRDWHYARLVGSAPRHVVLPSVERPLPTTSRRPRYLRARLVDGRVHENRWMLARAPMPREPWAVARVVGERSGLVLYRITGTPWFLVSGVDRANRVDPSRGVPALAGFSAGRRATPDGRLRVTTYWRMRGARPPVVALRVAGVVLDTREVGRGNWTRALESLPGARGPGLLVEDHEIVVPSHVPAGTHALELGVVDLTRGTPSVRWIPFGRVSVG